MKPIDELKSIISNQKTVSTSRLAQLIRQLEKTIIQQEQRINNQQSTLGKLNKRMQIAEATANRRRHLGIENQELREKISRQKRELATLTETLSRK